MNSMKTMVMVWEEDQAHLEQDVQWHVGHVLEAPPSTTNGLSTSIRCLFTGSGIASGFGFLRLGFLAWWHGEGPGRDRYR